MNWLLPYDVVHTFLIAVMRSLTNHLKGRNDFLTHGLGNTVLTAGKAWWLEHKGSDHTVFTVRKQGVKNLVFCLLPPSLLLSPRVQPIGWNYPNSEWVLSPQLNLFGNISQTGEAYLLGDSKSFHTDKINHHILYTDSSYF